MSALAEPLGAHSLLALACGLGVGTGVTLMISAFRGRPHQDDDDAAATGLPRWPLRSRTQRGNGREEDTSTRWLKVAAAVGAAILAGVFTGWPVAAVLTGLGVWVLPGILGRDPRARARLARIEAIASWTEMLRDTLAAAAGLEQAIAATAPAAPAAIRPQVQELQRRLDSGQRLRSALHEFADSLDDAAGDLVVAALVLASQAQARQLGDLLASLAVAAREQVTMRLRVEAGRASTRTSVRIIVSATLVMAAGMVLLNRTYLQPYDSLTGQLTLTLIAAVFAFALWWLDRIADVREPARVLTNLHPLTSGAGSIGQPGPDRTSRTRQ